MRIPRLLTILLPLLGLPPGTSAKTKPKNAILLSTVRSLTLKSGAQTTHRRVPAAPQLKCVSHPKICALHSIPSLRCTNDGAAYGAEDIQWSCTAPLPPELKLGSTDVVCEGYEGPDDDYVLKGSCGVEYRLVLTEQGERKFPDLLKGGASGGGAGGERDWSAWVFGVIFVAVAGWIIYSAYTSADENQRRPTPRRPRNGGGGGGGGGWGPGWGPGGADDDPPPPYPGSKPSSSTQKGWRPGFWSGTAAGAAAGYLAGNRGGRQHQQPNYGSGWGSDSRGAGSHSGWGAEPSRSSSGSSSSSTSTARYESTGFGGTSRR